MTMRMAIRNGEMGPWQEITYTNDQGFEETLRVSLRELMGMGSLSYLAHEFLKILAKYEEWKNDNRNH